MPRLVRQKLAMGLLASHKLRFDQVVDQRADRGMVEAIDDFVEEAAHEKLFRDRRGNAAGEEIEHLVLAELAGGRAVTAFDVVGQDFEAGH